MRQWIGELLQVTTDPAVAWARIGRAPTSPARLALRTVVPLSLIAPVATVFGMRAFDTGWSIEHGYQVPADAIVQAGAVTFVASVSSVFVLAAIFWMLAPLYRVRRDWPRSFNVAAWGAVPLWLSGALLVLPALALASMAGLVHSLYLYYVGVGAVLDVRSGSRAEMVGVSMVLLALVSTLAGAAASAAGLL